MKFFVDTADVAEIRDLAATGLVAGMLPVLILYLFLSDKFIEGMTAGAVKG